MSVLVQNLVACGHGEFTDLYRSGEPDNNQALSLAFHINIYLSERSAKYQHVNITEGNLCAKRVRARNNSPRDDIRARRISVCFKKLGLFEVHNNDCY